MFYLQNGFCYFRDNNNFYFFYHNGHNIPIVEVFCCYKEAESSLVITKIRFSLDINYKDREILYSLLGYIFKYILYVLIDELCIKDVIIHKTSFILFLNNNKVIKEFLYFWGFKEESGGFYIFETSGIDLFILGTELTSICSHTGCLPGFYFWGGGDNLFIGSEQWVYWMIKIVHINSKEYSFSIRPGNLWGSNMEYPNDRETLGQYRELFLYGIKQLVHYFPKNHFIVKKDRFTIDVSPIDGIGLHLFTGFTKAEDFNKITIGL